MFKGIDSAFTEHMDFIANMFDASRGLQKQRDIFLKDLANMGLLFR